MRIQHNIAALNAHRYLSQNNDAVAKNLEKLSSGYRINRAGDDAAGLSISEKMRAQITGLETAKKNAQDGVSLVQTAEGNLTEVHSMLNRMVELSTQAANGTYQDLNRKEIQKEITSLTSEIDRISSSANFNGIKLLDGSLSRAQDPKIVGGTIGNVANAFTDVAASKSFYTSGAVGSGGPDTTNTLTISYFDENGKAGHKELTYKLGGGVSAPQHGEAVKKAIEADSTLNALFDVSADGGTGRLTVTSKTIGAHAAQVTDITSSNGQVASGTSLKGMDAHREFNENNLKTGDFITLDNGKTYKADNHATLLDALLKDGFNLQGSGANTTIITKPTGGGPLTLQVGESNDKYQQVLVNIKKTDSKSLGVGSLDLTTQNGALAAIDTVSKAIDMVSSTRGDLGAIQNRLEHTINNLSVTDENMTAAESRIRDVDMAKEMMDFTKNNILTQAAQSMLAQANTLPQGVLQLLK